MGRPVGSETNYQPTEGWRFEVIIGEYDYTDDINSIRIASSLSGVYPIFTLNLLLNPNDILVQEIYGHLPIKLTIRQYGHSGPNNISPIVEDLKIELLYISSDFNIPISEDIVSEVSNKDLIPLGIIAVPAIAFRAMTTYVNKVYFDQTPLEVFSDLTTLLEDNDIIAEIDRSSPNVNNNRISQLLVPPTTVRNILKQIDSLYGMYKGMTEMYCAISPAIEFSSTARSIVARCLDLSYRMMDGAKSPSFTITQLANTGKNEIMEQDFNKEKLITYQPVHSEYQANKVYAVESNNVFFISNPENSLYSRFEYNLQDFAQADGYGLIDGNDKRVYVNPILRNRKKLIIDGGGYNISDSTDFSDTHHYSNLIRKVATLSQLTITMEKDTPIEKLLWIGEPVKFESETADYVKLTGRYILYASDIQWRKDSEWKMQSKIKLVRTNRNKAQ